MGCGFLLSFFFSFKKKTVYILDSLVKRQDGEIPACSPSYRNDRGFFFLPINSVGPFLNALKETLSYVVTKTIMKIRRITIYAVGNTSLVY